MSLLDRPPFTAVGLVWRGRAYPQEPVAPVEGGTDFRVVTSNALRSNRRADEWARAVLALRPDVLCVQELTDPIAAALERAGVGDVLPGGCAEAHLRSAGSGIWTALPVESTELGWAGYVLAAARLSIGVTVASIHTVAPSRRRQEPRWWESFEAVSAFVARTPGPLVAAGDWNATLAHTPLRRLLDEGRLRCAHLDVGRARAATFPARVPLALLDRVLVSDEVAVRSVVEHRLPGSDHRAVVAELAVTPPT